MWGQQFKSAQDYIFGGLAQLARAPALHAGGQRFESVILHMVSLMSAFGRNILTKIFDILQAKANLSKVSDFIY